MLIGKFRRKRVVHPEEEASKLVLWQPKSGLMNVGRPAVTYTDTCNLKSDTCLESVNLELRTAMLGDLAGRGVLNRGVLLLCRSSSSNSSRVVQLLKYSPNSRCHLSSWLLAVPAMFLANCSPIYSSWNEWNFLSFFTHYQNNSTSSPGLLSCKIVPNLVDNSWLWWMMHGILAAIRNGEIFWMTIK